VQAVWVGGVGDLDEQLGVMRLVLHEGQREGLLTSGQTRGGGAVPDSALADEAVSPVAPARVVPRLAGDTGSVRGRGPTSRCIAGWGGHTVAVSGGH
jgi:hypothetical protein